jgi:hypothetical protein
VRTAHAHFRQQAQRKAQQQKSDPPHTAQHAECVVTTHSGVLHDEVVAYLGAELTEFAEHVAMAADRDLEPAAITAASYEHILPVPATPGYAAAAHAAPANPPAAPPSAAAATAGSSVAPTLSTC